MINNGGSGGGGGAATVAYDTPENHGAKRDGKLITDAAMTSGQGTLTSASGPFASSDVGKLVLVQGAGNAGGMTTLVATITGYTDAQHVTLSANAAATVSAMWALYGSDDTAAINASLAGAVAASTSYYAEVRFTEGVYMVGGAPTQAGNGNAQIPLPLFPMGGRRFTLGLVGCPDAPTIHYALNATPALPVGVTLVCARTDGTDVPATGPACVVGGPNGQVSGNASQPTSNLRPVIDGINIAVPYNSSYSGFDFFGCVTHTVKSASVSAFASPTQLANSASNIVAANRWTFGLRTTTITDDGNARIEQIQGAGLWAGLMVGEHVTMGSGVFFYNYHGVGTFTNNSGNNMLHSSRIEQICCEGNWIGQLSHLENIAKLDVGTLDVDGSAPAVYDPNNNGRGTVTVRGANQFGGAGAFTVNGAGYMRIINGDTVPGTGSVAQPAVPASTVAFQNTWYRDALVYIAGGTVSVIGLGGTPDGVKTLGITSGLVVVPPGHTITLTYSVAPTWFWTLL